jgi:hypothetical protein
MYLEAFGTYPILRLSEMSSGWVQTSAADVVLTMTVGNTYTVTISDDGTTLHY